MRKKPEQKPLNIRQRKFLDLYVQIGVGHKAAAAAGYIGDARSLAATASRILAHRDAQEYLAPKTNNSPEVMGRIALQQYWNDIATGLNGDFREQSRIKASELLAKSQGILTKRVKVDGSLDVAIRPQYDYSKLTQAELLQLEELIRKIEGKNE